MRKTLSILALGSLFAVLSFGENYSGKLVDASCYSQQKKATGCEASAATTTFGLDVNGKVYMLDSNGNTKATSAMKNRADRAANPNSPSKEVMATVTGTESGGTITVETIDVQ